jgi:hypothetical protein
MTQNKKGGLTEEGRRKLSETMKARWAARRAAQAPAKPKDKRKMSAATRQKLSKAAKKRWAEKLNNQVQERAGFSGRPMTAAPLLQRAAIPFPSPLEKDGFERWLAAKKSADPNSGDSQGSDEALERNAFLAGAAWQRHYASWPNTGG